MTQDKKVTIAETPRASGGVGGMIQMSQDVVATIAGIAAREIPGIHALGRSRLISFGDSPTRGVGAEVGSTEAALDLDVIIDYGCDIRQVAGQLRTRIANEVDRMAGRKVVEVNINVVGIDLPEDRQEEPPPSSKRVK